jgi:SAM-dependent methyltransferase
VERGIVTRLASELVSLFDLHLWRNAFPAGSYILDVLVAELDVADGALLVFAADDEYARDEGEFVASRDNVILEYGFFVAGLGRERVFIVAETGVTLPSDLTGLTVERFDARDDVTLGITLDNCARKIRERWRTLPRRRPVGIADDGPAARYGYAETLRRIGARSAEVAARVEPPPSGTPFELPGRIGDRGEPPSHGGQLSEEKTRGGPLVFDSTEAALSTYAEALARVENRFWTTTFLSSGFWNSPQPNVLSANNRMMNRLGRSQGQARRLFLLDAEPEVTLSSVRSDRIYLRTNGRSRELRRSASEFEHIKRNVRRMVATGCEVRVTFDSRDLHSALPPELLDDPGDSELAIYDRFRVDSFAGGSVGRVLRVKSFCPTVADFETYLSAAESYFDDLWQDAQPIDGFLDAMQRSFDSARTHIDYESNWLTHYEFDLDRVDTRLKETEAARVRAALTVTERWGMVGRYLDIGTCTGRYLLLMRDAVRPDGELLGVDEDLDCVRFTEAALDRRCPDDTRIRIECSDFLTMPPDAGPFDLVTCMLGTLSHFGWNRSLNHDDALQDALVLMRSQLAHDGLLILGTWSQLACERHAMLKIYRDSDRRRLAQWTPPIEELHTRLREADLEIVRFERPEARLDLTVARPRTS